jgi:serine/threonine protein phosphatase 1
MDENLILVIGDIHGCYFTLKTLCREFKNFAGAIYSTGDLIDRGKHSKMVVDFCIEKKIKPVRGNHEDMMLRAIMFPGYGINYSFETTYDLWMSNGGGKTMMSYIRSKREVQLKKFKKVLEETGHLEFFLALPLIYEFDSVILSHAGIVEGKKENNVLWNREPPSKLDKFQITGHNPSVNIIHKENHYVDVDTGCVYGFSLSAVIVDTSDGKVKNIISVPVDERDV